MNRGQIRGLIYNAISQTEGSSDFTGSEINGFIDKGVRFLAPILKWPRTRDTLTPVAGTAVYALSGLTKGFVCLLNAYYGDTAVGGDVQPLDVFTEETLTAQFPKWLDANSSAWGQPRRIILQDRSNFLIHPTPDAPNVVSNKKIHIGYVYLPDDMSSDSSTPDLPTTYHDFLVDYGKYECYSGKLSNAQEGARILGELMNKSKMVSPLITREYDHQYMTFGAYADDMNDADWGINFY